MDFFRNTYKDTLRLVRGNDFATIHNIVAKYPDDTEVDGFDLNVCTDLMVRIKRDNGNFKDIETYAERWFILEPKKIRINFDGLKMKNGSYRIEFFGKFQGKDWRCYSEDKGFGVVESNEEANIPVETIIADGVYQILTDFTMTYQTQEQSDWEETDDTLPSYIKNKPELFSGDYEDLTNKPDLSVYVEKVDGKGLSENDYTDEDKQKVANAVTRTVADLANYYLKSETYTQNEVNELIASIENFHYEIYPNISYIASPLSNVLYLIGPTGSGSDRYEEYVYYNDTFVKIGDTSIDLSGYVTSFELSEALTGYVLQSSLASILSDYQEKLFSGINIKTINEQSILGEGNIEIQSGEENVIEVVKVNNVALTPDAEKAVNVSVPTALSQLNEDTTHRTVSDTEKSTWNSKANQSDFNQLANAVDSILRTYVTKSVNDLANYYTKTQTYTQAEVDALLGAINQFHYEIAESTSAVVSPASNVLYLIGPTGSGTDKYEEYVYTTTWVKIGDTSIDLSGYVTTTALNTALADYTTTTDLNTMLAGYQTKIDSAHKLDYSLLSNTPTIPDAQIQSDWYQSTTTAKDYIKNKPTIPSVVDSLSSSSTTSALSANQGKVLNEGKQDKIDSSHKLSADLVDDTSTTNKFVNASDISTWNGKADKVSVNNHGTSDTTFAVTPNVLHIWGTVGSLTLTLATPTDNTIKNEYMIQFASGSTATQFSLPQGVEWGTQDPEQPNPLVVKANAIYQISIENNIGLWTAIANS